MLRWPRRTPGSVSTSMSFNADFWCSAKLRICACANSMSSMVCGETEATKESISPGCIAAHLDIGDEFGDGLLNFAVCGFDLCLRNARFQILRHSLLLKSPAARITRKCRRLTSDTFSHAFILPRPAYR